MKQNRSGIQGMSLLEVMLVLAIGSGIIVLGLRQYESLKRDSDASQLLYNVDQIFQAAADYYQANCRRQIDPLTGLAVGTAGTLDPDYTPQPTNPYSISVADLISGGYLTAKLPSNPLVNESGSNGGYVVQFNLVTPVPDRTVVTSSGSTVKLGQIIMWRIQVAANLKNATTATSYKNILRADCLSAPSATGTAISPCSDGVSGTYVVWERLPSFAVPESNSNLWMTNATVKKFNQLYQTYPMLYLMGLPTSYYPQQNYLCGS